MSIRIIIMLSTLALFGFSADPGLKDIKAGNGGALVDVNIARFGDPPAPTALPATENPAVNGKYDFSVVEIPFRESSFLANDKLTPSVKLLARNRGYAPVSVSITYDGALSENMKFDANKPHTSVVPPHSEMVVARFDTVNIRANSKLAWGISWEIGDYSAKHACPEGYRFPFANNVPAYAEVTDHVSATFEQNAVTFSMPAGTRILAARKGTVIRIKAINEIEVLHEDSTIASYSHLGEIDRGIRVGKTVNAGEPLGVAGKALDHAYMRLAVWRPELKVKNAPESSYVHLFRAVSFPLEFCTEARDCTVLTRSRPINSTAAASVVANKPFIGPMNGEYDFSITYDYPEEVPFVPDGPVSAKVIAANHGHAPVSVTFDFNHDLTENINPDVSLPYTAVILPRTETVLARLSPLDARKGMKYSGKYFWQLGDFTTRHQCTERYRYPFARNIRAFACVSDPREADPFTRYSVQFSLPAGSKVLAVRNGVVVRVRKDNDIDILHNDSTIATYSHIDKIESGICAGKSVSAGEILGTAGESDKADGAYMQITVWRPEQLLTDSLFKRKATISNFQRASVPLEFCSDSQDCMVYTHNQWVSTKHYSKKENNR